MKKKLLNLIFEMKNYDYSSPEVETNTPVKKEQVKPIEIKSLKNNKNKKLF